MVKIRLQRVGTKKRPNYRIIAVDSRGKRDGRFLEILGQYQPQNVEESQVNIKEERIQYWMNNGAQPTKTTLEIFKKSGIWDRVSKRK